VRESGSSVQCTVKMVGQRLSESWTCMMRVWRCEFFVFASPSKKWMIWMGYSVKGFWFLVQGSEYVNWVLEMLRI